MERERAEQVIRDLESTYFSVTVVRSAPTVGQFSRLSSSMLFHPPPAKVSVLEIFNIPSDILCGKGSDRSESAAIRRLMGVVRNESAVLDMITTLLEKSTERLQFLTIAESVLQHLTPVFEVDRKTYSELFLREQKASIKSSYMGMGSRQTWHGTPDGRADFIPVIAATQQCGLQITSDRDSDQSLGGKTFCEAKTGDFDENALNQLTAQAVVSSFVHKKSMLSKTLLSQP